jgi:hypothetical protein
VLAGLAWCALAADHLADAAVFAADAAHGALSSGDLAAQLLADTVVAAVNAVADPTRHNMEAFIALARRRPRGRGTALLPTNPT